MRIQPFHRDRATVPRRVVNNLTHVGPIALLLDLYILLAIEDALPSALSSW